MHRMLPYENVKTLKISSLVIEGMRPEISSDCPAPAADLMRTCWDAHPDARPPFGSIVQSLEMFLKSSDA